MKPSGIFSTISILFMLLLVACSDSSSEITTPPSSETKLIVRVQGLPVDSAPSITISSEDSITQKISEKSQEITISPGTYYLFADYVIDTNNTVYSVPEELVVTVAAGETKTVTLQYVWEEAKGATPVVIEDMDLASTTTLTFESEFRLVQEQTISLQPQSQELSTHQTSESIVHGFMPDFFYVYDDDDNLIGMAAYNPELSDTEQDSVPTGTISLSTETTAESVAISMLQGCHVIQYGYVTLQNAIRNDDYFEDITSAVEIAGLQWYQDNEVYSSAIDLVRNINDSYPIDSDECFHLLHGNSNQSIRSQSVEETLPIVFGNEIRINNDETNWPFLEAGYLPAGVSYVPLDNNFHFEVDDAVTVLEMSEGSSWDKTIVYPELEDTSYVIETFLKGILLGDTEYNILPGYAWNGTIRNTIHMYSGYFKPTYWKGMSKCINSGFRTSTDCAYMDLSAPYINLPISKQANQGMLCLANASLLKTLSAGFSDWTKDYQNPLILDAVYKASLDDALYLFTLLFNLQVSKSDIDIGYQKNLAGLIIDTLMENGEDYKALNDLLQELILFFSDLEFAPRDFTNLTDKIATLTVALADDVISSSPKSLARRIAYISMGDARKIGKIPERELRRTIQKSQRALNNFIGGPIAAVDKVGEGITTTGYIIDQLRMMGASSPASYNRCYLLDKIEGSPNRRAIRRPGPLQVTILYPESVSYDDVKDLTVSLTGNEGQRLHAELMGAERTSNGLEVSALFTATPPDGGKITVISHLLNPPSPNTFLYAEHVYSQDVETRVFSQHKTLSEPIVLNIANAYPSLNPEHWQLLGNAQVINNRLILTPDAKYQNGAAWNKVEQLNFAEDFQKKFTIYLGYQKSGEGGDGMVLAISKEIPQLLGAPGGHLGFGWDEKGDFANAPDFPICQQCIGIEMDTYYNEDFDPTPDNHVALLKSGSAMHTNPVNVGLPFQAFTLADGQEHELVLVWKHEERLASVYIDEELMFEYYITSLAETLGGTTAYYGFTGATWGATNEQYFVPLE